MSNAATVVLVHGAWHGAWCWTPVVERLTDAGVPVVALDLPGHGDDPRPLSDLHGHGDAVRAALDDIDAPVLLVGHSFGGAAITDAGTHPAVRRLVYLTAFCLDAHETVIQNDLEGGAGTVLEQAIRFEADGTMTVDPELAVEAFYADCDPADVPGFVARLGPELAAGFTQSPRAVAWRARPSTYVLCTDDRAVLPALQHNLAARCDTVVEIDASHSPFVSRPDELAELLTDLAGRGPDPDVSDRIDQFERTNRAFWDDDADDYQAAHHDDISDPAWGAYRIPESELHVLGDLGGLDVLELGCGGAQASLAFAAAASSTTGVDLSISQLRHAAVHVRDAGRKMGLVCASASATPFRAESFDVVFCDHGAMGFCDPAATVPEAARLLRRDGLFAFSLSTLLHNACFPPGDPDATVSTTLQSAMFGARAFDWGDGTIDFQMLHSEWIALFRANGFVIEDLLELRPPAGARTGYEGFADVKWARRWPAEEIWKVRKA